MTDRYTADSVRASLQPVYETYFAKLAIGQAPNWKCCKEISDNFCLTQWMIDECKKLGCSETDSHNLLRGFNRRARSETDLFQVAADFMNTYLDGNVQNYDGLRRH